MIQEHARKLWNIDNLVIENEIYHFYESIDKYEKGIEVIEER